jgi:hypothetical protein
MSEDRRITPRKVYTMPVQIRVRTEVFAPVPNERVRARSERLAAVHGEPRHGPVPGPTEGTESTNASSKVPSEDDIFNYL